MPETVTVHLAPGTFYAGTDWPWYASQDVVAETLRARFGVTNVKFHPKSTPLPAGVSPSNDPKYSGPWSEWVSASYSGPERSIRQEQLWSWLDFVPLAPAEPKAPEPEPYGPPLPPGWVLPNPEPSPAPSPAPSSGARKKTPPKPAKASGAGEVGLIFALGSLAGLGALLWLVRR